MYLIPILQIITTANILSHPKEIISPTHTPPHPSPSPATELPNFPSFAFSDFYCKVGYYNVVTRNGVSVGMRVTGGPTADLYTLIYSEESLIIFITDVGSWELISFRLDSG
jgi:hypothetical protein